MSVVREIRLLRSTRGDRRNPAVYSIKLSPQLFSRWRDGFIENGKNLFVKQENPDSLLLREIDDYKRLVAKLTLANEELKKL